MSRRDPRRRPRRARRPLAVSQPLAAAQQLAAAQRPGPGANKKAPMDPELIKKRDEYEARKARTKALLALKTCTICGADKAKACQGCGTTAYCSTECQRVDWRDRGHRKACKKIRAERAAEDARAEAPPSPPEEVFYGPAPRSRADEARARIAVEQKAARAWREANPAPKPLSARFGSRCPICFEDWFILRSRAIRQEGREALQTRRGARGRGRDVLSR